MREALEGVAHVFYISGNTVRVVESGDDLCVRGVRDRVAAVLSASAPVTPEEAFAAAQEEQFRSAR